MEAVMRIWRLMMTSEPKNRHNLSTITAVCVFLAAGVWVYSGSFAGQFIFDDATYTGRLQRNHLWEFVIAPASRARIIVSLSLAANYVLGGLEVWGYHAFNLAVHLLAALALFGILRRTFQGRILGERLGRQAGWLALAVAMVWLVHPVQTESVTYIWQRCESLAGLFYLLTLYCVIRGAETKGGTNHINSSTIAVVNQSSVVDRQSSIWYSLAVLACALGMASKATVITAPPVVFAYDRIFLAGSSAGAWRQRRGLYAGLAATWLLLAALIFSAPPRTQADFGAILPFLTCAETQLVVILHYLLLIFWPAGLCLDYSWQPVSQWGEILPGVLIVGGLILATLWAWFRRPAWSFIGVWFFGILAPTSSLPFLQDLAFEHRLYLPLAAVATAVVIVLHLLGKKLFSSFEWRPFWGRLAAGVALAPTILFLGYFTYQRNRDYQDPVALWNGVIAKRPENPRAYCSLGCELNKRKKYAEAIKCFDNALALNPCLADVWYNRGQACGEIGENGKALEDYTRTLALNSSYVEAWFARGNARNAKGDLDGAISDYSQALALNPRYANAWLNCGNVRREKGDFDGAILDYTQALVLDQDFTNAYYNRGLARREKGDPDGAIADCSHALSLNPRLAEACGSRGLARQDKGDYAGALEDYGRSLVLDGSLWQVWINKGLLLAKLGREKEANECFAEGLKINPGLRKMLPGLIERVRVERRVLQEKNQTPK
jgi:tetratricopeptide (TPR) repeat protein